MLAQALALRGIDDLSFSPRSVQPVLPKQTGEDSAAAPQGKPRKRFLRLLASLLPWVSLTPGAMAASAVATTVAAGHARMLLWTLRVAKTTGSLLSAWMALNLKSRPNPGRQGVRAVKCPWPFVLFHDLKVGFRDWPTWLMISLVLWRWRL